MFSLSCLRRASTPLRPSSAFRRPPTIWPPPVCAVFSSVFCFFSSYVSPSSSPCLPPHRPPRPLFVVVVDLRRRVCVAPSASRNRFLFFVSSCVALLFVLLLDLFVLFLCPSRRPLLRPSRPLRPRRPRRRYVFAPNLPPNSVFPTVPPKSCPTVGVRVKASLGLGLWMICPSNWSSA